MIEGPIENLFSHDKPYTFLVGAGISIDAPSKIPSSRNMVRSLLEFSCPPEYFDDIISLNPRFEIVTEEIQKIIDPGMHFLDFFDRIKDPNPIHMFLARAIQDGAFVITTNFDFMIERALQNILPKRKYDKITPVITKSDYEKYSDPNKVLKSGRLAIYKIHGSSLNIITRKDTSDSLVATLASLGKDREAGQTFTIEAFKKPVMEKLLKNRTLVIMGYSGGDDFDLGPLLQNFPDFACMIWVDHSDEQSITLIRVPPPRNRPSVISSGPDQLLQNTAYLNRFPVFCIKANTLFLIKNLISKGIFPKIDSNLSIGTESLETENDFHSWIKTKFVNISLISKYKVAGDLLKELGSLELSLEVYYKGYHESRKISNDDDTLYFLNGLGLVLKSQGNYLTANVKLTEALQIAEKNRSQRQIADLINNIAQILEKKGDFFGAISRYSEALHFHEKVGDLDGEAINFTNLGMIYKSQGNIDAAKLNITKALEIFENLGNLRGKSACLLNLGQIHQSQGEYTSAIAKFSEALRINQNLGDIENKANCLSNIAQILQSQGDYQNAIEKYSEALRIDGHIGNLDGKATIFNNLGIIYKIQGDIESAKSMYKEALDIFDQQGNLAGKATLLNSLGMIYKLQGDYTNAVSHCTEALNIAEQLGDLAQKAVYLNNLGTILLTQMDYLSAIKKISEAVHIAEELGDLPHKTMYLNNLGMVYDGQGNFNAALTYYSEAFQLAKKVGDQFSVMALLNNIGMIYKKQGDNHTALEKLLEAFYIADRQKDQEQKATLLWNIGSIHESIGEINKGLAEYQSALAIFTQLKSPDAQKLQEAIDRIKSRRN